ncbi:MAG TPA: hypothetical protein PLF78_13295 [Caulobacter sp.]|nr:hypothetical protein [Caulobacter sp.]
MHRVDTDGNADNAFADGDPQVGQQGTVIDEVWLNDVQENLCLLIEAAGIALVKADGEQLKDAVMALDAALLVVAKAYTDTREAAEIVARDAAIAVETAARVAAVAAEAAIRLAADNALDVRLDAIEDALDEQATVGSGHWMKHPCGVIEQWGIYAGGASNPAIVFPIAFPTACEGVQVTAISNGATSTTSEATSVHKAELAAAPTTAGFSVFCSWEDNSTDNFVAATTTAFHWRAIGR